MADFILFEMVKVDGGSLTAFDSKLSEFAAKFIIQRLETFIWNVIVTGMK